MIVGFIGNMGGGKTLSMVKYAYEKYLSGFTIYSNIHLDFPHKKLDLELILDYANEDKQFPKSVFLIDEAHIYLEARRSASKRNIVITYFILQTRKKDILLLYTTQNFYQVEKRLREQTDVRISCYTKKVKGRMMTLNKMEVLKMEGTQRHSSIFCSEDYYHLYNTYEVVPLEL